MGSSLPGDTQRVITSIRLHSQEVPKWQIYPFKTGFLKVQGETAPKRFCTQSTRVQSKCSRSALTVHVTSGTFQSITWTTRSKQLCGHSLTPTVIRKPFTSNQLTTPHPNCIALWLTPSTQAMKTTTHRLPFH